MLVATLLLARTSLTDFDLLLGAYVAILACISVSVGHYTVRALTDKTHLSRTIVLDEISEAVNQWNWRNIRVAWFYTVQFTMFFVCLLKETQLYVWLPLTGVAATAPKKHLCVRDADAPCAGANAEQRTRRTRARRISPILQRGNIFLISSQSKVVAILFLWLNECLSGAIEALCRYLNILYIFFNWVSVILVDGCAFFGGWSWHGSRSSRCRPKRVCVACWIRWMVANGFVKWRLIIYDKNSRQEPTWFAIPRSNSKVYCFMWILKNNSRAPRSCVRWNRAIDNFRWTADLFKH